MFTGKEDMEATALREQGWSISAIARHLGRSRATVRNHLNGKRVVGERRRAGPDAFEAFVPYLRERLREDPHVWATALYDEVVAIGFELSYPSLTRGLRRLELRPHCEACQGVKGRATIEIEHPPGEEILCRIPHRISYVA
jgi:transposase